MSQTKKTIAILNPGRNQTFRKSVFKKGERSETMQFIAGEPVEIKSEEQFKAIADAIGPALCLMSEVEGVLRVCRETTRDTIVAIAETKAKAGLTLTKHQASELKSHNDQAQDEADDDEAEEAERLKAEEAERLEAEEAERLKAEEAESKAADITNTESAINELTAEIETLQAVIEDEESSQSDAADAKKDISKAKAARTRAENKLKELKSE